MDFPLSVACTQSNDRMISFLLEHGADPFLRSKVEFTYPSCPLEVAISVDNKSAIRLMLDKDFLTAAKGRNRNMAMRAAVIADDRDKLSQFLAGKQPGEGDGLQWLLKTAIILSLVDIINVLIDAGAQIDGALPKTTYDGYDFIDIEKSSTSGRYAWDVRERLPKYTALSLACRLGNIAVVKELLLRGANVNEILEGWSALLVTVRLTNMTWHEKQGENMQIMDILIKHGANPCGGADIKNIFSGCSSTLWYDPFMPFLCECCCLLDKLIDSGLKARGRSIENVTYMYRGASTLINAGASSTVPFHVIAFNLIFPAPMPLGHTGCATDETESRASHLGLVPLAQQNLVDAHNELLKVCLEVSLAKYTESCAYFNALWSNMITRDAMRQCIVTYLPMIHTYIRKPASLKSWCRQSLRRVIHQPLAVNVRSVHIRLPPLLKEFLLDCGRQS
jgi:hypothetical protein